MSQLHALLSLDAVRVLLQCDGFVYGNAVRECFTDRGMSVVTYLTGACVTGRVHRKMRDVVERSLYPLQAGPAGDVATGSDYEAREYRVRGPEGPLRLVVSYVHDFQSQPGTVASVPDFHVNLLEVGRTGLRLRLVPDDLRMHPCPLLHVLEACARRTLQATAPPRDEEQEAFLLRRVAALCGRGWTHAVSRVELRPEPPADALCPVCYEDTTDLLWVRVRPCDHLFHLSCLEGYRREACRRRPSPAARQVPHVPAKLTSVELAPLIVL